MMTPEEHVELANSRAREFKKQRDEALTETAALKADKARLEWATSHPVRFMQACFGRPWEPSLNAWLDYCMSQVTADLSPNEVFALDDFLKVLQLFPDPPDTEPRDEPGWEGGFADNH